MIEKLPVPMVPEPIMQEFEDLADLIFAKNEPQTALINIINMKIYNLLNLTSEEIAFIESMVEKGAH
jgi:hypothetical protein